MSGIAIFLPNETMRRQAEAILKKKKHHVIVNEATTIDTVVEEARKAIELGANIVVARGHQAADVREYTSITTIEVVMTAQELGLLIVKAKKMLNKPMPKIGIFCWKGMLCDTTYFEELYDVKLAIYWMGVGEDYFEKVEAGILDGIDVVIGGEKCVQYATQKNFPVLFMGTTGESIEIAINQAETMYAMAEKEMHNYAQFSTVLDSSNNGIIKIGADGLVQTMNRVMEEILKVSGESAIGRHITELFPTIDKEAVERILEGEEEIYSTFVSNGAKVEVVTMEPIMVEQVIWGAIISCSRTRRLSWSEDKMKEKLLSGFVAYENLNNLLLKRPGLKEVIDLAKVYAQSNTPILIEGSSGDELEQLCQGIHNYSLRKNGPFVIVNMETIPVEQQMQALFGISENSFSQKKKSAFVKASDGTIVIREISRMSLPAQYCLLNVIRKRWIGQQDVENESIQRLNSRIIALSSRGLKELVLQGKFRKDLYHVLKAFYIALPGVSERREELAILLDQYYRHYLDKYSRYHVLTQEARERILNFPWDNNDIQLESFCERMILTAKKRRITEEYVEHLLGEVYDLADEEPQTRENHRGKGILEERRIHDIETCLLKYNGNRTLAAEELNISKSTLWRYMKKYGIK